MKKTFNIKGMHCNSCANLIENSLKEKVNHIKASYSKEQVEIDFDKSKISENEIRKTIEELGYKVKDSSIKEKGKFWSSSASDKIGWTSLIISIILLIFLFYYFFLRHITMPELTVQNLGDNASIFLLFLVGILTGFHCIAMCGGFVLSYTSKNAIKGHKSFKQHLIYGGSKVLSYAIIGGIFGLIGGIIAFSIVLRGYVAIFAGLFMLFYALSMLGLSFFRKFQINPKFLTKFSHNASKNAKGYFTAPFVTGLLNGLFIACGPLQAMYLYAAGTGSIIKGATSLAVFGLGTLPIMLGFGSLATVISHKTTKKILKFSAIIVIILGLIMLNRGLILLGSPYNFTSIKEKISPITTNYSDNKVIASNGIQEVNMNVDANGYSPNSFVIKKGVPVKWDINVIQLTGCNSELVLRDYNIDLNLKQGMNTAEFTPDKDETLTFTCGMGMLKGNFIVTETGTATQERLAASTPKSSGSCNMGSNGGGCGMASCGASSGGGCGCGSK